MPQHIGVSLLCVRRAFGTRMAKGCADQDDQEHGGLRGLGLMQDASGMDGQS
jgi:hypothetical protein